jgi:hypothetical protein
VCTVSIQGNREFGESNAISYVLDSFFRMPALILCNSPISLIEGSIKIQVGVGQDFRASLKRQFSL